MKSPDQMTEDTPVISVLSASSRKAALNAVWTLRPDR
jgi:hypothetical protein